MRAIVAAAVLAACAPPARPSPIATPREGISIAIYERGDRGIAVVDDRRTVTLRDGAIVLDDLDVGAALQSLVIEPLDPAARLELGTCTRAAGSRSSIRCAARGPAGERLVRILYVTTTLAYRAIHDVVVAGERATIETRFEVETPPWERAGSVTLFDGLLGGDREPRLLASRELALDGTTLVIDAPARTARARRVVVFDPSRNPGDDVERDQDDAERGVRAWEWAELDGVQLSPGAVSILAGEEGDDPVATEVATTALAVVGEGVRVPLRPDGGVRGVRTRRGGFTPDGTIVDHVTFVLTNGDPVARTVLVEEPLRSAKRRTVDPRSTHPPTITDGVARLLLEVPPSGRVRARFSIAYPR